ncbi:unnamed protein product, partial [Vicia faba]
KAQKLNATMHCIGSFILLFFSFPCLVNQCLVVLDKTPCNITHSSKKPTKRQNKNHKKTSKPQRGVFISKAVKLLIVLSYYCFIHIAVWVPSHHTHTFFLSSFFISIFSQYLYYLLPKFLFIKLNTFHSLVSSNHQTNIQQK